VALLVFLPGTIVAQVSAPAKLDPTSDSSDGAQTGKPAKQEPSKEEPPKETKKPPPTSLEAVMEIALKQNPDILFAEAKIREAEAELKRVQQQVLAKIMVVQTEIKGAQALLEEAQKRMDRLRNLLSRGGVSNIDDAQMAVAKFRAELERKQTELAVLTGKIPVPNVPSDSRSEPSPIFRNYHLTGDSGLEKAKALVEMYQSSPTVRISWTNKPKDIVSDSKTDVRVLAPAVVQADIAQYLVMPIPQENITAVEKLTDVDAPALAVLLNDYFERAGHRRGLPLIKADERTNSLIIMGSPKEIEEARTAITAIVVNAVGRKTSPPNSSTERIGEALGIMVKLDSPQNSVKGLLDYLQAQLAKGGIKRVNLVVASPADAARELPGLKLAEPVTLAAALQMIEDQFPGTTGLRFYIREYGIVGMPEDVQVPPGAVRLSDFFRGGAAKESKKQSK